MYSKRASLAAQSVTLAGAHLQPIVYINSLLATLNARAGAVRTTLEGRQERPSYSLPSMAFKTREIALQSGQVRFVCFTCLVNVTLTDGSAQPTSVVGLSSASTWGQSTQSPEIATEVRWLSQHERSSLTMTKHHDRFDHASFM